MRTIGFATKYYTLWEVSKPIRVPVGRYGYKTEQHFHYIQNLSLDLEKAKKKLGNTKFQIDLSLRGSSSFKTSSEVFEEIPEDVFGFGKYKFEDIEKVGDYGYLHWYYEETSSEYAKKVLLKNGYVEHNDYLVKEEDLDEILEIERRNDLKDSSKNGHHFEDKEKVELEIMQVSSGSFNGSYGTTYIVSYVSKCGKLFKYMGAKMTDISTDSYDKIRATIKHDTYNGVDETKIIRIKKI